MHPSIRTADAIHVGTSGWAYDDWAGVFYPPGLRASDRLEYYASRFDALEVNVSFYRLPTPAMIDAWNRQLPENFQLIVKGPRTITHLKKLADYRELLKAFWARVRPLRALRMVLWQLPPTLGKDVERLDGFLADLPAEVRHAVEFRHESWWDGEVVDVLARHDAAMVTVSHPTMPDAVVPTCNVLFVRFHGITTPLYRYDYTDVELAAWKERLQPHFAGRRLFAMFNNGYGGNAVRNAIRFREMLIP